MTDPRSSWAVPLFWEVTSKALGGRREALIRWGMFTDAISYRKICRLPQSLRTETLAVWGSCFAPGEPPINRPLRELCAEGNHGNFGHEKHHKTLENIADSAGGQGTVAWWPHLPALQKSSKNARLYRFLLRASLGFTVLSSASRG